MGWLVLHSITPSLHHSLRHRRIGGSERFPPGLMFLVKLQTLADGFEALIGAIFLDGGFGAAQDFVLGSFHEAFGELTSIPTLDNPKGELQEFLQASSAQAPEYEVVCMTGPEHDRVFECVVRHEGLELGRGSGKRKKAAESEAALAALRKVRS